MVRVVGPLRVVTDRPLLVSQVRVRAARDRAERGGLTAAFNDSVPVVDGQLDMVVLPGPAVLVLEVTGGFSHAVKLVVPDVAEATLEQCVTAAQVAGEADKRTLERLAGEVARDAATVAGSLRAAADSAEAAGVARAGAEEALSAAVRESTDASEFAAEAEVAQREAAGSAERAAVSEREAAGSAERAGGFAEAADGSAQSAASDAQRVATIAGSTRWVGTRVEVNGALSPDLKGEQGEPGRDGATSWTAITGKPSAFPPTSHMHSATDVRATLITDSGSTTRTVQEHLQDLYDKLRRLDAGAQPGAGDTTQPDPQPEPEPQPEPGAGPFAIAYNGPTATTIEDVLKLRRGQWAALNELIELSNRKTDPAAFRNRALATREIGAAIGIGALPDTSFITSDAVASFRLSAIAAASKDTSDYTTISAQITAFDAAVKAKEVTL